MYTETLQTLADWSNIAYSNEDLFLDTFGAVQESWILTKLSWSDTNMDFTYIIKSGQHICDSVKIEKWFEFLKTNEL